MVHVKHFKAATLVVLVFLAPSLLLLNLHQSRSLSTRYMRDTLDVDSVKLLRTKQLQQLLQCKNKPLRLEVLQHGNMWMVQNLIIGEKSRETGCAESITYTTNGDFTFIKHVKSVAKRWLAPISMAIFAPGYDLNATLTEIQKARNCHPGSEMVRKFVSFHVYFPLDHMPHYVPHSEQEALAWPYHCTELNSSGKMYKTLHNLTYPINVGRNIARRAVNTHFILASDVELYPSLGLVDQFLDMVAWNHSVLALDPNQPRRVYPLPVFEVVEGQSVPGNRTELLNLYRYRRAQLFHAHVCATCHAVPGWKEWIYTNVTSSNMSVLTVGKRIGNFRSWEPFYVSDNSEPIFDERVTWEGQSNKRIQGYAMCLLNYEYHVLQNGFLVHSPGIKHAEKKGSSRLESARRMTKFIKSTIEPEYRILYGRNKNCTT